MRFNDMGAAFAVIVFIMFWAFYAAQPDEDIISTGNPVTTEEVVSEG